MRKEIRNLQIHIKEPVPIIRDDYNRQPSGEENTPRIIENGEEYVSYLKNSFCRIWYNMWPTNYDAHWHDALEVIVPVKNGYTVILDDKTYTLHAGDIFLVPQRHIHSIKAPAEGVRITYLFNMEKITGIKTLFYIEPLLMNPLLISEKSHSSIYEESHELFLKMCNAYFDFGELRELIILSLLFRFFILLGTENLEKVQQNIQQTEGKQGKYYNTFEYVFEYINTHFREELPLEKVASVACFSKYHFSRLFKQYTGMNYYEFLTQKRINEAITMLSNTNYSITDIALETGFENLTSFNRSFKKLKGCSPREFKKRQMN